MPLGTKYVFLWLQTIYIPAQSQRVGRFFAFLSIFQLTLSFSAGNATLTYGYEYFALFFPCTAPALSGLACTGLFTFRPYGTFLYRISFFYQYSVPDGTVII